MPRYIYVHMHTSKYEKRRGKCPSLFGGQYGGET